MGRYGTTSPVAQARQHPDTIAVGYYGFDLHGGHEDPDLELELESHTVLVRAYAELNGQRPQGPFGIPLRALVSRDVRGLILAEKNISQSRLAAGATRVQPDTTLVGAAAGTLATVALLTGLDPRQVPAEKVQYRLARTGQYLATNRFLDLPRTDPATVAFELAALANLDPNERHTRVDQTGPLSRARALVWIRRALGLTPAPGISRFRDVPAKAWYAADVEAVRRLGVPLPCATRTFCPTVSVTRSDFLVWLARAMDARWGTAFTRTADPRSGRFVDVPRGTRSAIIHAMAAHLRSHGVPFESRLRPSHVLRRRHVALWTAWERFDPRFPH